MQSITVQGIANRRKPSKEYDEVIKELGEYYGYDRTTKNRYLISAYDAKSLLIKNGCKVLFDADNIKVWELTKR